MQKCLSCGRPLSFGRGLYSIVCKECEPSWPRVLAERKAAEVKAKFESEIKYHLKNEKMLGYGIAYWDINGTSINSALNKVFGIAMGSPMAGQSHRLGILVLTEAKLWIIELGDITGEKIDASTFFGMVSHCKAASYALEDMVAQEAISMETNTLTILQPIQMNATFPSFSVAGTENIAALIAKAITTANKN